MMVHSLQSNNSKRAVNSPGLSTAVVSLGQPWCTSCGFLAGWEGSPVRKPGGDSPWLKDCSLRAVTWVCLKNWSVVQLPSTRLITFSCLSLPSYFQDCILASPSSPLWCFSCQPSEHTRAWGMPVWFLVPSLCQHSYLLSFCRAGGDLHLRSSGRDDYGSGWDIILSLQLFSDRKGLWKWCHSAAEGHQGTKSLCCLQ